MLAKSTLPELSLLAKGQRLRRRLDDMDGHVMPLKKDGQCPHVVAVIVRNHDSVQLVRRHADVGQRIGQSAGGFARIN